MMPYSHCLFTTEAWVDPHSTPYGICGEQSDWAGFSLNTFIFPCLLSSHLCSLLNLWSGTVTGVPFYTKVCTKGLGLNCTCSKCHSIIPIIWPSVIWYSHMTWYIQFCAAHEWILTNMICSWLFSLHDLYFIHMTVLYSVTLLYCRIMHGPFNLWSVVHYRMFLVVLPYTTLVYAGWLGLCCIYSCMF
jgi:hypothetical protein